MQNSVILWAREMAQWVKALLSRLMTRIKSLGPTWRKMGWLLHVVLCQLHMHHDTPCR